MRDRHVRGWPRHERGDRVHVLELAHALTRRYSSDAHCAAYRSANGRRLVREALDVLDGIEMTVAILDVDCPEVHGTPEPAPAAWRAELADRVRILAAIHPDPYVYHTRGGARVVYRLDAPQILLSQADAQRWSQQYATAVTYLEHRCGIVADPACADWQRLYRLPHATRSPGAEPESWPVIGDATQIGTLSIVASRDDVAAARRRSKAFRPRREIDVGDSSGDGRGVLYHLLLARGDLIRDHDHSGAIVIRCPREPDHSCGRTGDGSTLLYPPARGESIGAIHCLHGHCAGMSVRDWLGQFAEHELEAARRASNGGRDARAHAVGR